MHDQSGQHLSYDGENRLLTAAWQNIIEIYEHTDYNEFKKIETVRNTCDNIRDCLTVRHKGNLKLIYSTYDGKIIAT